MTPGRIIFGGALLFLGLQICLFAGYHFNIIQMEEEADIEHELQQQLRLLMEDNHELQSKADKLHVQLATESAMRTGLQLQLLKSDIVPHDMRSTSPADLNKMKGQVDRLREQVEKNNMPLLSGSFMVDHPTQILHPQEQQGSQGLAQVPPNAHPATHQQQHQTPVRVTGEPDRTPVQLGEVVALPASERIFPPSNEDSGCPVLADPAASTGAVVAGVVIVAFNRPDYLERTLNSVATVMKHKPEWKKKFPVFVSHDGSHGGVRQTVLKHQEFKYLNHVEITAPKPLNKQENLAYYRIANHYKFIMRTMFDCLQYTKALILEDDMQLSMDFFEYFEATAPLLDEDKSIYAVSSWNDHGQSQFVGNASQLYRSDFFPGLGWMLTKDLWDELRPKWPRAYWDDWMRQSEHRKGRQSIRPEVCRTFNFGEKGSSKGQFYKKYISTIHLNTDYVPFASRDLSYLKTEKYGSYWSGLMNSPEVSVEQAMKATGRVKVLYNSQEEYEGITAKLGMLREWKDGVPRGAYQGVVPIRYGRAHIFIAPKNGFHAEERVEGKVDKDGALIKRPKLKRLRV